MKNLKFLFFSMFMALFLVTACTNDEPVAEDPEQTEDSQSITEALGELRTHFDQNGNVTQSDNPSGNVVFDFCFDFVYPLTLSYNNGTTVTVENLDGLVDVMVNSTDELYINGIAFPFDVETYDEDSNSIVVETINNEEAFIELLEDCVFDDIEACECTEEYDPVCVEVTDPNGETFTMTYPNECYAECDGFSEDDFLDSCEDDYNPGGGIECFTLNYPLSIIVDGETIEINSEEEFGNALYNAYTFDFVYPFTVTVYDDDEEETETINGPEDIEDILEDCYDDYDGGYDDCEECEDEPFDPVCIEYTTDSGETTIEVFPNMCFAECLGFTENNVVECEDDNNPQNCTEDEIVEYLTECEWYGFTSLLPNQEEISAVFNANGTVTVEIDDVTTTGTWETASNPQSGEVFVFFVLSEPLDGVSNLDWTVTICSETYIQLESNNEILAFERDCD